LQNTQQWFIIIDDKSIINIGDNMPQYIDENEFLNGAVDERKQKYIDENEFLGVSPSRTALDVAKDVGISLAKGTLAAGQGLVGLADIPTGGKIGKAFDSIGIRPDDWQKSLDKQFSPAQQAANKKVEEAKGFLGTVGAMFENPSTIAHGIVETLPSVAAGGLVGRGALALGSKLAPGVIGGASKAAQAIGAGAFGEGTIAAGQSAEEIRTNTADRELTAKQAGLAALSGLGTAAFGIAGGALAKKFGLADIDTWAVGMSGGKKQGFKDIAKSVVGGGISEGVFEELPQTVQETILQNAALDKPLLEGVPEGAAQAIILGGVMGGGANLLPGRGQRQTPPPVTEQPETEFQVIPPAPPRDPVAATLPIPRADVIGPVDQDVFADPPPVKVPQVVPVSKAADMVAPADVQFAPVEDQRPKFAGTAPAFIPQEDAEVMQFGREAERYNQRRNQGEVRGSWPGTAQPETINRSAEQRELDLYEPRLPGERTPPPQVDYISDQAAKRFEEETLRKKQDQQWQAANAKWNAKNEEIEATITAPDIPHEVKKAARLQVASIVNADPVYQHMEEVKRRGGLNLGAFKGDYDAGSVSDIQRRYPGIFSKVGVVKPDEFAQEKGYESLDDMVQRFSSAKTKREIQAAIIKELHGQWQDAETQAKQAQGRDKWAGRQYQTKKPLAPYPARESDVAATIDVINRNPESAEELIDNWQFSPEQRQRIVAATKRVQPIPSSPERSQKPAESTPIAPQASPSSATIPSIPDEARGASLADVPSAQTVTAPVQAEASQYQSPMSAQGSGGGQEEAKISSAQLPPGSEPIGPTPAEEKSKAGAPKHPWEMDHKEWNDARTSFDPGSFREDLTPQQYAGIDRLEYGVKSPRSKSGVITHYDVIKKALSENKPVPAAVLADYPDLAAKYGQTDGQTAAEIAPPIPTESTATGVAGQQNTDKQPDKLQDQPTEPPTLPEDQRTMDSPDGVATEGARPLPEPTYTPEELATIDVDFYLFPTADGKPMKMKAKDALQLIDDDIAIYEKLRDCVGK
jgi:hypothetical protein